MSHDPIAETVLDLIRAQDPEIAGLIGDEARRQEETLELIASENHVSRAVMHAMGTCLTNKYAEGYPGARYYGGCEYYDKIETIAIDRACRLFGCKFANVQPHSGAQANMGAMMAILKPGETFASLVLKDGGHLSHGMSLNFSGIFYKPVHYPLHYDRGHADFERIDYDAAMKVCMEHKPKAILCGYSAYPRVIDFKRFREIADACGALLMADIAHIAGLVAAGVHPSPFPHAHVVTTTTHKTLRGPRGGLIMTDDEELAKKINKSLFPGVQGGPLMHIVGAKGVALGEALRPEFKDYARRIVANARALAAGLSKRGWRLTSGGTDNHLMLVDLSAKNPDLTGQDAETWMGRAGIVCNKNGIPSDTRPPKLTSGVRLGTPAITTRGLGTAEMDALAGWIDRVLGSKGDEGVLAGVKREVVALCGRFPMPGAERTRAK